MSGAVDLAETDLATPVASLFPIQAYDCYEQVPLARKRIDLVFVDRQTLRTIAVELKISNWKRALWQATVNFQVSQQSYIAMWHKYVHRAQRNIDMFAAYGVGIIAVNSDGARFILPSQAPVRRIPRSLKQAWYRQLHRHE
jgi:hypothetical protein